MKKIILSSAALLLALSLGAGTVQAVGVNAADTPASASTSTSTSTSDAQKIASLKALYASLDESVYSGDQFFKTPAHLSYPFDAGTLKPQYISATTAWVNYYRTLVGLNAVPTTSSLNSKSQIAAAAMAAAKANPNLDQHGLANAKKPAGMSTSEWRSAQATTATSNLFFHAGNNSPAGTVGSLIADNFNLDGLDTGHRAWLLSSRLSAFGIGAALGSNGWRYIDQAVINPADYDRDPAKNIVAYPGNSVFPIEELTNNATSSNPIPWSVYFSNDDKIPASGIKASIEDTTSGQKVTAQKVKNYDDAYYGEYSDIITFLPTGLHLVAGHHYTVQLSGLGKNYPNGYSYSFELFSIKANNPSSVRASNIESDTNAAGSATVKYIKNYSVAGWTSPAAKTRTGRYYKHDSVVKYTARSYQNGTYWYKLTNGDWLSGQYLQTASSSKHSVKSVNYIKGYGIMIWNSPYFNQKGLKKYLKTGSRWRTYKHVTVNNVTWYNLGGNQWIDSTYLN